MAMCCAPFSLLFDNVIIEDVEVVKKSYPNFWLNLKKVGFIVFPVSGSSN